jgi:hypothetical protein
MKKQIAEQVKLYLKAASLESGERQFFASHSGADYAYFDTEAQMKGSTAVELTPEECIDEGFIYLVSSTVMFCGSPLFEMDFDVKKIRRRVEDALRKTTDEKILAAAMLLDIRF